MYETDREDVSERILKVNKEEDYLRQVNEIEEQDQNYVDTDMPMSKKINPMGLKKQVNVSKAKKSLMFNLKSVSVFRLYCHLSETFEIFLMIMGFIGSVAAGAANPIMAYLTGTTTSDASESAADRIDDYTEEEKKIFFERFKEKMD